MTVKSWWSILIVSLTKMKTVTLSQPISANGEDYLLQWTGCPLVFLNSQDTRTCNTCPLVWNGRPLFKGLCGMRRYEKGIWRTVQRKKRLIQPGNFLTVLKCFIHFCTAHCFTVEIMEKMLSRATSLCQWVMDRVNEWVTLDDLIQELALRLTSFSFFFLEARLPFTRHQSSPIFQCTFMYSCIARPSVHENICTLMERVFGSY